MFDSDVEIYGRHAAIIKHLVNNARLFQKYIDAYNTAALFGLLYNQTAEKDKNTKERARIYADAFSHNRSDCMLVYRLVMLLEATTGLDLEKKIDRAFRDDAEDENVEAMVRNMDLFHSYVRGGLEVMNEQFLEGCYSENDYLRRAIDRFASFKMQVQNASLEEAIDEFLNP